MKVFSVVIFAFIIGCLSVLTYELISGHDDDLFYSKDEVNQLCDFDLSETDFELGMMNNNKYTLLYKASKWQVIDGGGKSVVGFDSCYVKFRAYQFWLNSPKTQTQ